MDDPKTGGNNQTPIKLPTSVPIMGDMPKVPTAFAKNSVSVIAYLLLTVFAMAATWSLTMLGLKNKFVALPQVAAVLAKNPDVRDLVENHYDWLWWFAFIIFFLSGVSAAGMLKRRIWSLHMLRLVTWFWFAVLVMGAMWAAGQALGVFGWCPLSSDGAFACVVAASLTFVIRYVLDRAQVKSQFGVPVPKRIVFLPIPVMMPDMNLTAVPRPQMPTP